MPPPTIVLNFRVHLPPKWSGPDMSFLHRILTAILIIVCVNMSGTTVFAQLPQARLDWIFPTGLQAGTSTDVQLSGADLDGITRLVFSHSGFSAKPGPEGRWTINADAALASGIYELRAVGQWGITNPVPIIVGNFTEIRETEPNSPASQQIKLPVTVQGQIQAATDVDIFAFEGKKDQRIVIDFKADQLDSPLDGTLKLIGPNGTLVAENLDTFGYDPNIELKLPETGLYQLHVFDAVYSGSPAHRYCLTIHDGPVIDSTLPMAVESGKSVTLKVLGRGLNAGPDANYFMTSGFPEESKSTLFPVDNLKGMFQVKPNDSNADAPVRHWLSQLGENGPKLSSPVVLAVAEAPVVVETESNNIPENAQQVILPCDFSGVFQKPGDLDYISFHAKKDETWLIQTIASRQGSLANPEVLILQRKPDGSTAQIAELAEQQANPFGPVFETATVDRMLTWKVPNDGDYLVRMRNLNRRDGNARCYYRLVVRQLKPDFQIIAINSGATGPTGTTFFKGSRSLLQVLVNRKEGFDLPVRVTAVGLPQGVSANPLVFNAGQVSQNMVFETSLDAVSGEFPIRLKGETHWSDEKASVDWVPGQKVEPDFQTSLSSLGAGLVKPLVGPNNQQRGISRYQENLMIAIRETPVPFQIDTVESRKFVKRGSENEMEISLTKFNAFDDKVAIRLDSLPANMDAVNGEIPKGQNSVKLKFKIGANVALGRHTIYFNGSAPFPFDKNPAADKKKNITWNLPSKPVTLIVTP